MPLENVQASGKGTIPFLNRTKRWTIFDCIAPMHFGSARKVRKEYLPSPFSISLLWWKIAVYAKHDFRE